MGVDGDEFTPLLVARGMGIVAKVRGFEKAANLARDLDLDVSASSLSRLATRIGGELAERSARTPRTEPLARRPENPPALAVVECDGGRIRVREPDRGPGVHLPEDAPSGWRESKHAILVRASHVEHAEDPRPDPPACFLDSKHAARIAEAAALSTAAPLPPDERRHTDDDEGEPPPVFGDRPRQLVRTVLSSMAGVREFGRRMAREARQRRFGEALARAFLGDGLAWNWTIWKRHFADYVPILDFVHVLSYLHAVARVLFAADGEAWTYYARWLTVCWRGGVDDVITELREHAARLGPAAKDAPDDDPAKLVARTIGYLENNRDRMRYPEYRRAGLPVTTAWMESAVKEVNQRVKGTEMFWNDPAGAEAILQIRAAALSDDDRLTHHLRTRPGCPFRRHSTMKRIPAGNKA